MHLMEDSDPTWQRDRGQQLLQIRGQPWRVLLVLVFVLCFKIENGACRREEISSSRKDETLQIKGLLEKVQDNIIFKTCQATHRTPVKPLSIAGQTPGFLMSGPLKEQRERQPRTVLSADVEICTPTRVLSSPLLLFPGADEDMESPEPTTARPLAKVPFTSTAPQAEASTPRVQTKMPAGTKVRPVLRGLPAHCKCSFTYSCRLVLLRGPVGKYVRTNGLFVRWLCQVKRKKIHADACHYVCENPKNDNPKNANYGLWVIMTGWCGFLGYNTCPLWGRWLKWGRLDIVGPGGKRNSLYSHSILLWPTTPLKNKAYSTHTKSSWWVEVTTVICGRFIECYPLRVTYCSRYW